MADPPRPLSVSIMDAMLSEPDEPRMVTRYLRGIRHTPDDDAVTVDRSFHVIGPVTFRVRIAEFPNGNWGAGTTAGEGREYWEEFATERQAKRHVDDLLRNAMNRIARLRSILE